MVSKASETHPCSCQSTCAERLPRPHPCSPSNGESHQHSYPSDHFDQWDQQQSYRRRREKGLQLGGRKLLGVLLSVDFHGSENMLLLDEDVKVAWFLAILLPASVQPAHRREGQRDEKPRQRQEGESLQ